MTSESGWLHSNQKGKEVGEIGTVYCLRGQQLLPAKSGYLTQHYSPLRNAVIPVQLPGFWKPGTATRKRSLWLWGDGRLEKAKAVL
ncbi:MAG: hypothetical protein A2W46_06535 [Alphaproteobacteria bacterium RIFCSPHIGHO2_12_42_13]|nr:MAG: hypothetical protein A3E50_01495 [Alphaproteobacteria bacterium RIFCSPHIGHO2_12_FULL_42_100]OFW85457.1 MAG: hypothetical protein A2W06_00425 [Alphaproteobacteria bacterium RBG_16_42_14]OFW91517.1 MAG: hypothetical protein A3C41_04780 [Alphaproteobacteria bacterium RIFCSPHIGHO2_02_FULL_42_30]OFW92634.1 MAG: hypothetical protein A2W46_06535 [Alphaproteobacteria bacterium RIFCSPHIGHO2_12_42_13]OFX03193.1 MAG: hypothetical protein A2W62_02670 [Alphaproteobacteria bacterium RIFCSPLOWO2_02_42